MFPREPQGVRGGRGPCPRGGDGDGAGRSRRGRLPARGEAVGPRARRSADGGKALSNRGTPEAPLRGDARRLRGAQPASRHGRGDPEGRRAARPPRGRARRRRDGSLPPSRRGGVARGGGRGARPRDRGTARGARRRVEVARRSAQARHVEARGTGDRAGARAIRGGAPAYARGRGDALRRGIGRGQAPAHDRRCRRDSHRGGRGRLRRGDAGFRGVGRSVSPGDPPGRRR